MLTPDQLDLLAEGSLEEQKQLLWVAICKRYLFVREFAVEVIREKFLAMNYQITDLDYDAFFNRKADWHAELEQITDKTRDKLKQVVFRILREAGITTTEASILPAVLSSRMVSVIRDDNSIRTRGVPNCWGPSRHRQRA